MNCACNTNALLPIEAAKQQIKDNITPIKQSEHCDLYNALDRILSQDIVSPINVPAYDNSAMDGYALNYADLVNGKTLLQIGKSFAGNPFVGTIKSGECVRIMTGAQIPDGADTVVMQENTQAQGNEITFVEDVSQGSAIRPAGDDIKRNTTVLKAGTRISAINIGLLASLGIEQAPVVRQLRVAIFSTGDELQAPGEAPQHGRIFDSNRPMLIAMAKRLGAQVLDLGIIADNKDLIRQAFEKANDFADCVITSGGVSVGEADYTREILEEYGSVDFWKLAIKPGKPLAFGRLPNSVFFGLPGNPVSAAVTFDQIAAPALAYLAGCEFPTPSMLQASTASKLRKRPGRTDYQRARYYTDHNNVLVVESSGSQSSGVLSCFSKSNCYVVLENERGHVEVGEQVSILPFDKVIS